MAQHTDLSGRGALALALVALTALAVSGCSKAEPVEASVWDMPAVVWVGGAAPSGGAEDSVWAKEFREAQLMTSYTAARKDVSYAEYVDKFGYDEAARFAESLGKGMDNLGDYDVKTGEYVPDAPVGWAAQRLLVTNVTEDPDGRSAIVDHCYVIYTSVTFGEQIQCASVRVTDIEDGTVGLELVLPSESPNGADPRVTAEELTVDEIPTARWATPITASTLPGEVKMPLPRDYYVKLGVISE